MRSDLPTSVRSGPDPKYESSIINISALPPKPVADTISNLSIDLGRRGGLFEVDGVERHPHMTLYMARFPNSEIDAVLDHMRHLAAAFPRVRVKHTGFFFTPGNYYEVSYGRTDDLLTLHQSILNRLYRLRYSPRDPVVEEYFAPYSAEQRANAVKWGYDLAGELFRPHITITRFSRPPSFHLPDPPEDLSFEVARIGIFDADGLGAATKHLGTFELPPGE